MCGLWAGGPAAGREAAGDPTHDVVKLAGTVVERIEHSAWVEVVVPGPIVCPDRFRLENARAVGQNRDLWHRSKLLCAQVTACLFPHAQVTLTEAADGWETEKASRDFPARPS